METRLESQSDQVARTLQQVIVRRDLRVSEKITCRVPRFQSKLITDRLSHTGWFKIHRLHVDVFCITARRTRAGNKILDKSLLESRPDLRSAGACPFGADKSTDTSCASVAWIVCIELRDDLS
jgi:hypothetical protein